MKRLILFIVTLFFFLPQTAFADKGWLIDKFSSNIVIEQSGEIAVTENIHVDFQYLDKHGIYRDIPYIYDNDGEKTYTEITVRNVLQNNKKAEYKVHKQDNNIQIKIGDPNRTISGKNSYVIDYTVKGVLRGFDHHDELYWNATGNNWPVSIMSAVADVQLPTSAIQKVVCYQGRAGSTIPCSSETLRGKQAVFQVSQSLGPYEGLTIVIGYKKGLVPLITVQRPKTFLEKFATWPSAMTLLFTVLFGFGILFYLWYKYGRDYWFKTPLALDPSVKEQLKPIGGHDSVVVEYEPPEKLRPAEIGVLMDERADTLDVVATIIDLAARGFLTITEIPKKWIFGSTDYLLIKKDKDEKGLRDYEQYLLHELFNGAKEKKVSSLKAEFYEELKKVKDKLYQDVVQKKLFPSNPEDIRQRYLLLGIGLVALGVFAGFYSIANDHIILADVSGGIIVSGIILLFLSFHMPRRTAYGYDLYRRVRGYQMFIGSVEKYRQKFFEKQNLFNEILPYAIVFGLTEKFAKAMKDMGVQTNPTWYSGSRAFNAYTFNSSINGFSSSLSSAIASAPQSSGFSGGSSGGGFGGGGGGSW